MVSRVVACALLPAFVIALNGCKAAAQPGAPLSKIEVTDPRYKDLVFLVATVRRAGNDFVITNDSTQPWFDVTLVLAGASREYRWQLSEVDAGQTVRASAAQFADASGMAFDPVREMPNTLIVSAEIGEGGPTGVYGVHL